MSSPASGPGPSPTPMPAGGPSGEDEAILFEGRPALFPNALSYVWTALTLGLFALYRYFVTSGLHYKVTTRRIVVETGVLSKKLEQVDLYRIADYAVERPFGQRLVGTGNILFETLDKTDSHLALREIHTDVVALYEAVRRATEIDRKARGVRLFEG